MRQEKKDNTRIVSGNFFQNNRDLIPVVKFLSISILLYLIWYVVYELWLHPAAYLDGIVVESSININKFFLKKMGYAIFGDNRVIGIKGSNGVWIGDPCNGINLMALFAGFVLAFPGKLSAKLWYIPFGITLIYIMNVIRIFCLILIQFYKPSALDFNHTYTFTFLMYLFIFMLWIKWVKKFGNLSFENKKSEPA